MTLAIVIIRHGVDCRPVDPNGRSSRSPVPLHSGSLKDPVNVFKYRIRLWLVESLNTNGHGLFGSQSLPSGDGMGAYKWMYPSDIFSVCLWVLAVFVIGCAVWE